MMKSPVRWVGGKSATAKSIIEQFPSPNTYIQFIDVFGGGANILLNKPKYKHYELYNDLDKSLVNFWLQVRDNTQALVDRLTTLPYAYSIYQEFFSDLREDDDLEHAVRWFYLIRSNFKPRVSDSPDGWRSSCRVRVHSGYSEADAFRSVIKALHAVSERLQGVEIDCRDYTKVVQRMDSPRTLFYCDPPYIDAEGYYNHTLNHASLAGVLNSVKGRVVLSYYEHPQLEELYPNWRRVVYEKQQQLNVGGVKKTALEVLLFNF